LDIIEREGVAPVAIPPAHRVAAIAESLRFEASRAETPELEKELLAMADETVRTAAEVRAAVGPFLRPQTWEARVYTAGERMAVEREHTEWVDGKPRLDSERMRYALARIALGFDPGDLAPGVAAALVDEVCARCEPNPVKLDFLLGRPTASGPTETESSPTTAISQRS